MYQTKMVGVAEDNFWCADETTTLAQIRGVVNDCGLAILDVGGVSLQWADLYRCGDISTPFGLVLVDRIRRCGEKEAMASRPPFCVLSLEGKTVVRIEVYQGHHSLHLTSDLRSPALSGRDLPCWLPNDPHAPEAASEERHLEGVTRGLGLGEEFVTYFRHCRAWLTPRQSCRARRCGSTVSSM
jgi:hypothetical protein